MERERSQLALGRIFFPAILLVGAIGLFIGVDAQTSTVGSMSGTVRDPTGAVMPRAQVVVQEERTGFSRTVMANDEGFYSAPSLPFGRYSVSTAPQGFKRTVSTGLDLHVNENLVVNLTLEIGPVSETVTVSNEAEPVETRSGEVSSLVSEKQVAELPLNGGNYAQLVLMVPGVSPTSDFNTRGTGLDSFVGASVNGNGSNQNLWTVDGVNNMDVGSNQTLLVYPSIDSIQEFRVERNSFSAEFGQAQGAVINLITKGGTNQFHGTGFEFLRNDVLNASDFFLKRAGKPKAALRYNNFGFNFNGPIKQNKVFFFWSEEWRRERRGLVRSARVPTAAEKLGDFSGILTDPLPHDPATCRPDPNDPTATICDPFPGNKIPANRLSPVGLALMKVYSDPNNPGDPTGQNWIAAPKAPIDTHQDLIRGNVNITSKTNLMIRWINEHWVRGTQLCCDSGFPTVDSDWAQSSKSFAVKLTNTLSSSSINDFQFSRSGNDIFVTTDPAGQALNDEIASKFPTIFPHPQGSPFPTLWGSDGYGSLLHFAPWSNEEDQFIWKDDFSNVRGAHDLKLGALFSHNIKNEDSFFSNLYQFCQTSTRTGNAIADTLLKDLPLGCYSESDHRERALARWHDLEFYGNDTWKVRPRVTLTLGLRWSRYGQPYSANDRITNFVPRLYDGADPDSALVQAGTRGFNRGLVKNYNKGFQPRVGLALDIFGDGKTALRLGAGRYLSRTSIVSKLLLDRNPPWTQTVDAGWGGSSSSLDDSPNFRSLDTINPGLKNALATTTSFNAFSENFRPPESWQWNLTISREVMKNTVVEVSYIGNHALHIQRSLDWNEVVPSARLAVAQAVRTNDPSATDLINAGRRLPGVAQIIMIESTGVSNYDALQIWANRRFSDRLAFQAAYTWSHAITNVPLAAFNLGASDPFNYNLDHGDADLDRRQMFVANAVYVLPSFKRWGTVASQILGDWQLNGIASFLGGIPLDVTSGANTAGLADSGGNIGQRPNLVLSVPIYLHNPGDSLQYLNPAAFSLPEAGRFGTLGRGSIRGPGTKNLDFSIAKNWRIRDRYSLQLRAEMFNAFNHANFNNIDAGLSLNNVAGDENFGKSLNPNFGRITATRGPREIQFGLKFSF